jgi:hypothetical protein
MDIPKSCPQCKSNLRVINHNINVISWNCIRCKCAGAVCRSDKNPDGYKSPKLGSIIKRIYGRNTHAKKDNL